LAVCSWIPTLLCGLLVAEPFGDQRYDLQLPRSHRLLTWDAMTKRLNHMTGVIPVPPNYLEGLRFDFVDQATPAMGGPGGPWEFLETGPDSVHILFGEPLAQAQMDDLQ